MNSGEAWSHYLYNVVLWAPGHPPDLQVQVKKALADIDPNLVVQGVDKYPDVLDGDFQQQSMIATLTMLFGGLGLVLAAVGLYGVTAYTVEQRTSEIGVRMALGADRASVVRMVLRGAFLQVGIGLALGIPAAILAGRAMAGQLYGVQAVGSGDAGGGDGAAGAGGVSGGGDSGAAGGGTGSDGGAAGDGVTQGCRLPGYRLQL